MSFCEECGKPLEPGLQFCEYCGAKIDEEAILHYFQETIESGIVYTNLSLLSKKLNTTVLTLSNSIECFINTARRRGVDYTLVDVSATFASVGSIESHIKELELIVQKLHPKYLFILGSSDVIPSIKWENEASDWMSDSEISSDLPYATLDTNSPFSGQEYDFLSNSLRVGRLPNIDFNTYFDNIAYRTKDCESINKFAETAKVWVNVTKDICSKYGANHNVITSPDYEVSSTIEMLPLDTDLMFFNLHGSNLTKYWYGQWNDSYPEAVAPFTFKQLYRPYFLAVSACYGADYEDRELDESILLSALSGKCISFLGSSCIAFGRQDPPGSCADVIAEEYLTELCNGSSAGDSLAAARQAISKGISPEEIKTLAEFSLYGDPSLRLIESNSNDFSSKTVDVPFKNGINVPIPNTSKAIKLELCTVNQKIAGLIEETISCKFD